MGNVRELSKATPESAREEIAKAIADQEGHILKQKALLAETLLQKESLEKQIRHGLTLIHGMEGRLDTLKSALELLPKGE